MCCCADGRRQQGRDRGGGRRAGVVAQRVRRRLGLHLAQLSVDGVQERVSREACPGVERVSFNANAV